MGLAKEFPVVEMEGFRIGNAQNKEAATGVTVVLFDKDKGARAGVDVSGGGPASRETPLASPLTADNPVNAIVLSGGSAYGLAASDGVMHWLEEHGYGFDTGYARVPLVCQSCIYDLGYGRADVRPDAAMGYAACEDALLHNKAMSGSIGAGTGATVGKIYGMERSSKSGLGVCALEVGDLRVAAVVVVVNALGDIFNPENGEKLAGLKTEDGTGFADSREALYTISKRATLFNSNTTIGVLEKYVKQDYLLSLQQAIHKMTGMPADKIGLKDRGHIAENMKADIVIMDMAKIHDNSDYVNYNALADGINYVLINGHISVDDGKFDNLCMGRVLRR